MGLGAASAAALVVAVLASPAAGQSPMSGTWDLFWPTRDGRTEQQGWLVVEQTGPRVLVQVHGKGSLRASGTAQENSFEVRGRKMGAPFTIQARVRGERLTGSVKVLSVTRRFEGVRRREP